MSGRIMDTAMARRLVEARAAAHDKCFREQVAQGLKEADDPGTRWVTNDEAKAGWVAKRADPVKRVKGRAA